MPTKARGGSAPPSKEMLAGWLEEVESDERLAYPAALVEVNAPLALIQTELETKSYVLRRVLGMPPLSIRALRATEAKRRSRR